MSYPDGLANKDRSGADAAAEPFTAAEVWRARDAAAYLGLPQRYVERLFREQRLPNRRAGGKYRLTRRSWLDLYLEHGEPWLDEFFGRDNGGARPPRRKER